MTANVQHLQPQPRAKWRVLVVDDDLDTVHTMAVLIRSMGHEVQFAINGFAAIDIARKFRPQIIFLDLGLPDFRGDQIASQLKWEPGLDNARIIALSGRSGEDDRERAIAAGCHEYFVKPLDPAALESLLTKV